MIKMFSTPNLLTCFRLTAIPIILALFYVRQPWAPFSQFFLFGVAALTDFFDGYFARLYNQFSTLGRLLDPLADKLLVVSILFAFVATHKIQGLFLFPVIVIILREILISSLRERYMDMMHQPLATHWSGRWKTASQMVAITFLLAGQLPILGRSYFIFSGQLFLCIAATLAMMSACYYLYHLYSITRARGKQEP